MPKPDEEIDFGHIAKMLATDTPHDAQKLVGFEACDGYEFNEWLANHKFWFNHPENGVKMWFIEAVGERTALCAYRTGDGWKSHMQDTYYMCQHLHNGEVRNGAELCAGFGATSEVDAAILELKASIGKWLDESFAELLSKVGEHYLDAYMTYEDGIQTDQDMIVTGVERTGRHHAKLIGRDWFGRYSSSSICLDEVQFDDFKGRCPWPDYSEGEPKDVDEAINKALALVVKRRWIRCRNDYDNSFVDKGMAIGVKNTPYGVYVLCQLADGSRVYQRAFEKRFEDGYVACYVLEEPAEIAKPVNGVIDFRNPVMKKTDGLESFGHEHGNALWEDEDEWRKWEED